MKLWHLDPAYLDDRRLAQEHRSCHGLMKSLMSNSGIKSRRYYYYAGYVAFRHYQLAAEMRMRGKNHVSFIDKEYKSIPLARRRVDLLISKAEIEKEVQALLQKMKYSRSGAGTYGRLALRDKCPTEQLEAVNKIVKEGLPKDCFLI